MENSKSHLKIVQVQSLSITSWYDEDSFKIIYKLLFLLGFPFSSNLEQNEEINANVIFKIWCIFVIIMKTLFFIIENYYLSILIPNTSNRLSVLGFIVCGYINMWLIFLKRETIHRSVKKVCKLSNSLNRKTRDLYWLKLHCFFMSVLSASTLVVVVYFFFYLNWDGYIEAFGTYLGENNEYAVALTRLVMFSFSFTFFMVLMTCFVLLLLCENSFYTLGHLMLLYGKKIVREVHQENGSESTITKYITIYRQIYECVEGIDNALSCIVFFLYGSMISIFFSTLSVLLSDMSLYRNVTAMTYTGLMSLSALFTFAFLTISGSSVKENNPILNQLLLVSTEKIAQISPSTETLNSLSLLVENITSSDLIVTIWGLITIQKGFIVNIAGVLVTYGVFMYQLETLKNE